MNLFEFFTRKSRKSSAAIAKERLQIIVSHQNAKNPGQDFIKDLQNELLEVISKYINIDRDQIRVQLDRQGDHSVLELNVVLPDQPNAKP